MRPWVAVALALLASGCAAPDADLDDAGPQPVTPPLLLLTQGTFKWHADPGPSVPGVMSGVYNPVTQAAVSPCSYGGGAYFNNRPLPVSGGTNQRANSGNLTVRFDWAQEDFPGGFLVLGYAAPGMKNITDSPYLPRGEEVTIPIQVEPSDRVDGWTLYACINRSDTNTGDPQWQGGPFLGSFEARIAFQGDPQLPPPPANETRRTSQRHA